MYYGVFTELKIVCKPATRMVQWADKPFPVPLFYCPRYVVVLLLFILQTNAMIPYTRYAACECDKKWKSMQMNEHASIYPAAYAIW